MATPETQINRLLKDLGIPPGAESDKVAAELCKMSPRRLASLRRTVRECRERETRSDRRYERIKADCLARAAGRRQLRGLDEGEL